MLQNDHYIKPAQKVINGKHCHQEHFISSASYEIQSEEVHEIMSKMPHWIIRQGTVLLFAIVSILFIAAGFIHYPDVIVTSVNIVSSEPPVKLVAQSSGKIQKFLVADNQMLKKNEIICILENPGSYDDMLLLQNILNRLDTALDFPQDVSGISFDRPLQLGELQAGYAELYQSIEQYLFFREKNFINAKVTQLQSQVMYQSQLNNELQKRDTLLKQQLLLETKKYKADSLLAKEKVIAPLELDNSRKELIGKQMNVDATKSGILQNRLQQTEFQKTISDLQQQKQQEENDLKQKIHENVKRLKGQWQVWEQQYLIKTPVDGKAVFFHVWKENQYVNNGEAILMVVPSIQNLMTKASLPVYGAGKVKAGQKALIKLSAYPFDEFGMIEAKVKHISAVALDTTYSVDMMLSNGLITTANKKIPPGPQLSGTAEILTDDKSILERLFEKVWMSNKR